MIWSHCEFQGVPPSSTFFMSIGVGGADLMDCACESVPIPMHKARLVMNRDVFSAEIPTFSLRYESMQYVATRRATALLQVFDRKDYGSTRSLLFNTPACPEATGIG